MKATIFFFSFIFFLLCPISKAITTSFATPTDIEQQASIQFTNHSQNQSSFFYNYLLEEDDLDTSHKNKFLSNKNLLITTTLHYIFQAVVVKNTFTSNKFLNSPKHSLHTLRVLRV